MIESTRPIAFPQSRASADAEAARVGSAKREAPLQTLSRGLRILRFVVGSPDLVRLRDVAKAFDLERSVALRLLQTLEAEGFVTKHNATKAYSAGPALAALDRPPTLLERLTESARPFLAELTEATGLTSHVGMLDQRRVSLVEVRMAPGPVAVRQMPGEFEEIHCSAIGKAIYAFLPDGERADLAAGMSLRPHKARTLRTVEALERESAEIRAVGVAFDREEGPSPLACIASPILDGAGAPIASIGVSAIATLAPGPIDEQRAWIEAVRSAARRVSQALAD